MDIQAVRKTVSKIKGNLFKKSNFHSAGILKSHFKGTGLQFKEHQIYSPGDEVRFIDWKILAKTSVPFIKTFEEERNVEIVIVVDAGFTMLYGYKGISKLQAAIEICCLFYLLSKETRDLVHCIVLSDEIINLPKSSGEHGISILISTLEERGILNAQGKVCPNFEYKNNENSENRTNELLKYLKKNKEIIFISDFLNFLDISVLNKMAFRKNVHGFRLLAPLDRNNKIPYSIDLETGDSKNVFGKIHKDQDREVESLFGKKFKTLEVDGPYLEKLSRELV